jgi:hypothetical protein
VHSGYFFYRDVLKARELHVNTFSPCFMNIISPMDELFGEGLALNFTLVSHLFIYLFINLFIYLFINLFIYVDLFIYWIDAFNSLICVRDILNFTIFGSQF